MAGPAGGPQNAQFQRWQRQLEAVVEALFRCAQQEAPQLAAEWTLPSYAAQPDGATLARLYVQGRVLNSLLHHPEGLIRFVSDPRIPLDNNAAERALRELVIAHFRPALAKAGRPPEPEPIGYRGA